MARANEALRPLWILQKPRKVSLVKLIKPLKSTVNQLYLTNSAKFPVRKRGDG